MGFSVPISTASEQLAVNLPGTERKSARTARHDGLVLKQLAMSTDRPTNQADQVYNIKNLTSSPVLPLPPLEHRVPDFMRALRWCGLFGAVRSLDR